jgi:hypothetical protein
MPQNLWQDIFAGTLMSITKNGSKVILFSQIPEYQTSPSSDYRFSIAKDKNSHIDQFPDLPKQRTFENRLRSEDILIIDLLPVFCDSINCTRYFHNWLYLDTNHLSNYGAELIKPTILKYLVNINLN